MISTEGKLADSGYLRSSTLTFQCDVNAVQSHMQADLSVNYCIAERLIGGISGHCGLSPAASEVESCGEKERRLVKMPSCAS